MKKILTALIAATVFSAMALALSNTADARWGYGGYRGRLPRLCLPGLRLSWRGLPWRGLPWLWLPWSGYGYRGYGYSGGYADYG